MESLLLTVMMLLAASLMAFFWVRGRTSGKLLCIMLESDRTVKRYLRKVQGSFIKFSDSNYLVVGESIRFVRYPDNWPSFLQQTVPAALYNRGDTQPLDWTSTNHVGMSANELNAVLEPEWMRAIVKGTQAPGTQGRLQGMLPIMTLMAAGLSLVLTFYVISKLGSLQAAITSIQALGGGGP